MDIIWIDIFLLLAWTYSWFHAGLIWDERQRMKNTQPDKEGTR